jgi:uncharacterized protein YkwD
MRLRWLCAMASVLTATAIGCSDDDASGDDDSGATSGSGAATGSGAGPSSSSGAGNGGTEPIGPLEGDCAEFLTDDTRFTPALAKHFVDLHNQKRAQYCLAPLEWDPNLAYVAQQFAELGAGTLPGHNDDRHQQYADLIGCSSNCPQLGENISWHQPWDFWPLETMAEGWLEEEDWEPGCNKGGLHYTQMVYDGATHIGCGAWIDPEERVHFVCNYLGFQGPEAFPASQCDCGGMAWEEAAACE